MGCNKVTAKLVPPRTVEIMDKKLRNKVAVITGGSAGIGLGVAKLFAAEGAQVFIIGRRQRELENAANTIGANVIAVQGDTSKPQRH